MPEKPQISRAGYQHFLALPTRWMDNDIYGHVNNALYYAFFDTAINEYLIAEGGLDINAGAVVAYAAESQCQYLRPLAFPGVIDIGLRVGKLGNSSVRYEHLQARRNFRGGRRLLRARLRGSRDAEASVDAHANSHGTRTSYHKNAVASCYRPGLEALMQFRVQALACVAKRQPKG